MTDEFKPSAKAEPAGDLVKAIGNAIEKAWDECQDLPPIEFCDHEKDHIARAILALFQPQMEAAEGLLRALERANGFIANGIELGFIRMPDADTPDPAHETPGIVRNALTAARAAGLGRESHEAE